VSGSAPAASAAVVVAGQAVAATTGRATFPLNVAPSPLVTVPPEPIRSTPPAADGGA
jgi:hypothetical protein